MLIVFQFLPGTPGSPDGQFYVAGEMQIEDNGKAYSGYGTYIGGWNNGSLPIPIDFVYDPPLMLNRWAVYRLLLWRVLRYP